MTDLTRCARCDRATIDPDRWDPDAETGEVFVILSYDRLEGGELVALASNGGRTVAAIVHPARCGVRPWSLAGDIDDRTNRRRGESTHAPQAAAEAAQALGVELGLTIDGWEVP